MSDLASKPLLLDGFLCLGVLANLHEATPIKKTSFPHKGLVKARVWLTRRNVLCLLGNSSQILC